MWGRATPAACGRKKNNNTRFNLAMCFQIDVNGLIHVGKRIRERLTTADGISSEDIARKYAHECQLMSGLRHPNIALFMGIYFHPKHHSPLIVMEKLDGSLDDLLETIPSIPLPLKRSVLEDVARGLLYLHKHRPPVVHGDLTAKNVLLTTSFDAKITDYGNCRLISIPPDFSKFPSSQVYMPPERLHHTLELSSSLDIFSFGHLILFTLTQVSNKFVCILQEGEENCIQHLSEM